MTLLQNYDMGGSFSATKVIDDYFDFESDLDFGYGSKAAKWTDKIHKKNIKSLCYSLWKFHIRINMIWKHISKYKYTFENLFRSAIDSNQNYFCNANRHHRKRTVPMLSYLDVKVANIENWRTGTAYNFPSLTPIDNLRRSSKIFQCDRYLPRFVQSWKNLRRSIDNLLSSEESSKIDR